MTKYTTETRSFDKLKPGDLVAVPGGYMRFDQVASREGDLLTVDVVNGGGERQQWLSHQSNWPDVATGFTREYQAAHPGEVFGAVLDKPEA